MKDRESEEAAAQLYRLAQATALLRRYQTHEGHPAESPKALGEWLRRHPEFRGIPPSPVDYAKVEPMATDTGIYQPTDARRLELHVSDMRAHHEGGANRGVKCGSHKFAMEGPDKHCRSREMRRSTAFRNTVERRARPNTILADRDTGRTPSPPG